MKVKRKINFHEILIVDNKDEKIDTSDYTKLIFTTIQDAIKQNDPLIDYDLANGDGLQFELGTEIKDATVQIGGKARFIKLNELPDTYRKRDHKQRSLADEVEVDEGILEETHFAIDLRYEKPIIGIETSQGGPKYSHIQRYLDVWAHKCGLDVKISIEQLLASDIEQFLDAIDECATLEVKVASQNIPNVNDVYSQLGTILSAAQNFAKTEFVEIILSFNFRVKKDEKPNTVNLLTKVRELFRISKENKEFFNNFETLQIRGQQNDAPLQLYDLIADRLATEIYVEKRSPRSKYFLSTEFYESIKKEIGKSFKLS